MKNSLARREFLSKTLTAGVAAGAGFALGAFPMPQLFAGKQPDPWFKISLAQWSLHRMHRADKLTNLDFPAFTKKEFGIEAVEYVSIFWKDKARDAAYLKQLKQRCSDAGVRSLLIMVDKEGALGDPDEAKRKKSVENHYQWVEASKFLGGHSIRVNARSEGTREEQAKLAVDGLRKLSEFASTHKINVIVENHGGLSSDGKWLSGVIQKVDLPNCGTLPDFGNFEDDHDPYQGITEMMPFAKAVSAKSFGFDAQGNEASIDYLRMMKIVLKAGYRGYVGIEWEGREPSEVEGIRLTQRLLERMRDQLGKELPAVKS